MDLGRPQRNTTSVSTAYMPFWCSNRSGCLVLALAWLFDCRVSLRALCLNMVVTLCVAACIDRIWLSLSASSSPVIDLERSPPLTAQTRWTIGSVLFLASWAVLMGPLTYIQHLLSTPRLPFTAAYFGSIALTLYFAVGVSSSLSSDAYRPCPYTFDLHASGPYMFRLLHDLHPADTKLLVTIATQHPPDPHLLHRPTCRSRLVPCQLFSHGRHGVTVCSEVWHEQGRSFHGGLDLAIITGRVIMMMQYSKTMTLTPRQ